MAQLGRYRLLTVLITIFIVTAFVVGCAPQEAPPEQPDVEDTTTDDTTDDTTTDDTVAKTSIIILIPDNPAEFHGYGAGTGFEEAISEMVMLSVSEIDDLGNYFPELATEIPTVENGGVVMDEETWETVVTWHLREDVYWEDGEQVTADDVIFTWDAFLAAEIWSSATDATEYVKKIDDFTIEVKYYYPNPEYAIHFGGEDFPIFAEHFCDADQGYYEWDCNRQPLSDGPYILQEWVADDHLTFVRNENYYEEGKPYIDEVIFRIVPQESVKRAMMDEGDADVHYWPAENNALSYMEEGNGTKFAISPTERWVMKIFPNLKARGDTPGEETIPHPILADKRVRKALRMAIDVDTIINDIFLGFGEPVWSEFFRPPFEDSCGIPRPAFDMEAAKALIKEAGWEDTDGDGVNECHGCLYAEEGDLMTMEFMIYAEYGETLEFAHQFIAEAWAALGIETKLSIVEGAVLWAQVEDGGIELAGNFDINMWDNGYGGVDPTSYLWDYYYYASDSEWNLANWTGEEAETVAALVDELYSTDEEYRMEVFCDIAWILEEELPAIELFSTLEMFGLSDRMQGVKPTAFDILTWNVADWTVSE
ncbi:MAG: peptide ABC transporter substrate-binding protein [Anaerolineales bacterium]|nr:peptide ABC transporter substrate-binding protein [Anaerolineales bacterium]